MTAISPMHPLHLQILLHYFTQITPFNTDCAFTRECHQHLINRGWLTKVTGKSDYELSTSGAKAVAELLKFADADFDAIKYLMGKGDGSGKLEILRDKHHEVPPHTTGCICPKDANMSCQSPFCPRMAIMERYAEADAATKPPSVICAASFDPDWAAKLGGYPALAIVSFRGWRWISNIDKNMTYPGDKMVGVSPFNGKTVHAWTTID